MAEYTSSIFAMCDDMDFFSVDRGVEQLKSIIDGFRGFDEALTTFLIEHGYQGSAEDVKDKCAFISAACKRHYVPVPRYMETWFLEKRIIKKKAGYNICFAFQLDVEQSNDFFRRIFLERGIDCHNIEEAVYYFCIKNKLNYATATEILDVIETRETEDILDYDEIPYTTVIRQELDKIDSKEKLIEYITKNRSAFMVNMKQASEFVNDLWKEISTSGGLADQELSTGLFTGIPVKLESTGRSNWKIFKQIMGCFYSETEKTVYEKDRSIRPIFINNPMTHYMIAEDFPERQDIGKIGRHEKVGSEKMRKTLIIFFFYSFWVRKAIENEKKKHYGARSYIAEHKDLESCLMNLNSYLSQSGFHELYVGNPFDCIIYCSMESDMPLSAFREYMCIVKDWSK